MDKLLARPSLNLIVGDPGAKKTYLAIDLAISVASGKSWLGHPVSQCPVLFIDEESGLYSLWVRLNAALHAHQAQVSAPFAWVSLASYDLRHPQDAKEILNRAQSLNAGLIIFDALANLMHSSENHPASVQPVLFNLRRMADFCRAAVVVVHHTNRHGVFRGSSAIAASVDLMLSISSEPDEDYIELRSLKSRFSAPQPFAARAHFETNAEGQPLFHLTPAELRPTPVKELPEPVPTHKGLNYAILEFLAQRLSSSREQVISHCSAYSPGSVSNALQDLLKSGQVQRINAGSRGATALLALGTGEPVKY